MEFMHFECFMFHRFTGISLSTDILNIPPKIYTVLARAKTEKFS